MAQPSLFPDLFCGFVPVAPVHTDKITDAEYASVSVPTMIVMGEKDSALGETSKVNLLKIGSATRAQIIPKGRHPCYLDNPDLWHRLLHNFIGHLSC